MLFSLPMSIHLAKILDSIQWVKGINVGYERINNLKRELCSLVFSATRGPIEERKKANIQMPKTILACSDEFQIGCKLYKLQQTEI